MAYVIAEPCIGVKDTACVDVCPVDCIHPRKDEPAFQSEPQLLINPDECIDCGACVPVCLVTAIFAKNREEIAEGTMTFHLDKPAGFQFKAGQAIDVTLVSLRETDPEGNTRAFSLVSPPFGEDLVIAKCLTENSFASLLLAASRLRKGNARAAYLAALRALDANENHVRSLLELARS